MFPVKRKRDSDHQDPMLRKQGHSKIKNPLELETQIEELQPIQQVLDDKVKAWQETQAQNILNDQSLSQEQKEAKLFAMEFHSSINKETQFLTTEKKKFVLDFIDWLQYQDPTDTTSPAYVRGIEEGLARLGATHRREPLDVKGKEEWLTNYIDKKQKYSRALLKLRMGPHSTHTWDLHDAWLYYKYILRGEKCPDDGFLDDFDSYFYNKWKNSPPPNNPGGLGGWSKGGGRYKGAPDERGGGYPPQGGGQIKHDEEQIPYSRGPQEQMEPEEYQQPQEPAVAARRAAELKREEGEEEQKLAKNTGDVQPKVDVVADAAEDDVAVKKEEPEDEEPKVDIKKEIDDRFDDLEKKLTKLIKEINTGDFYYGARTAANVTRANRKLDEISKTTANLATGQAQTNNKVIGLQNAVGTLAKQMKDLQKSMVKPPAAPVVVPPTTTAVAQVPEQPQEPRADEPMEVDTAVTKNDVLDLTDKIDNLSNIVLGLQENVGNLINKPPAPPPVVDLTGLEQTLSTHFRAGELENKVNSQVTQNRLQELSKGVQDMLDEYRKQVQQEEDKGKGKEVASPSSQGTVGPQLTGIQNTLADIESRLGIIEAESDKTIDIGRMEQAIKDLRSIMNSSSSASGASGLTEGDKLSIIEGVAERINKEGFSEAEKTQLAAAVAKEMVDKGFNGYQLKQWADTIAKSNNTLHDKTIRALTSAFRDSHIENLNRLQNTLQQEAEGLAYIRTYFMNEAKTGLGAQQKEELDKLITATRQKMNALQTQADSIRTQVEEINRNGITEKNAHAIQALNEPRDQTSLGRALMTASQQPGFEPESFFNTMSLVNVGKWMGIAAKDYAVGTVKDVTTIASDVVGALNTARKGIAEKLEPGKKMDVAREYLSNTISNMGLPSGSPEANMHVARGIGLGHAISNEEVDRNVEVFHETASRGVIRNNAVRQLRPEPPSPEPERQQPSVTVPQRVPEQQPPVRQPPPPTTTETPSSMEEAMEAARRQYMEIAGQEMPPEMQDTLSRQSSPAKVQQLVKRILRDRRKEDQHKQDVYNASMKTLQEVLEVIPGETKFAAMGLDKISMTFHDIAANISNISDMKQKVEVLERIKRDSDATMKKFRTAAIPRVIPKMVEFLERQGITASGRTGLSAESLTLGNNLLLPYLNLEKRVGFIINEQYEAARAKYADPDQPLPEKSMKDVKKDVAAGLPRDLITLVNHVFKLPQSADREAMRQGTYTGIGPLRRPVSIPGIEAVRLAARFYTEFDNYIRSIGADNRDFVELLMESGSASLESQVQTAKTQHPRRQAQVQEKNILKGRRR